MTAKAPQKRKGRTFWSRAEKAGEAMEIGLRLVLGLMFATAFAAGAWWLGSHVWVGAAALLGIAAFPLGFLVGFFWVEVKFLLRLLIGSLFD